MKKFIDFYRESVTQKSGGGGGDTPSGSVTLELNGTYDVASKASAIVAVQGGTNSYADPVTPSGYTEYTPKEGQYVTQSDIAGLTPGESTFQRQFPVDTVVAKNDKVAFVGTVRNTTAEKYCIYGTVTYTAKYSSYVNIRIAVEGVIVGGRLAPMNVISKNGVHDVKGRNSVSVDVPTNVGALNVTSNGAYDAQSQGYDGYSFVSVNVPSIYAPSSPAYTAIDDHENLRTASFLEAAYANPSQNPFDNIFLYDPVTQGSKVVISGSVGDVELYTVEGEYYLWGVVDSYDDSTMTLTLSAVEGMSYTGIDSTTQESYARTIFTQNAAYENGTHRINVDVAGGSSPAVLVSKNITANGSYDPATDNADGYDSVTVNVPNSYTSADEGKVVYNGALASQTSKTIAANGTVDTTRNNSVTVNVPNSYKSTDEGKVVYNGALASQTSKTITTSGTFDTTRNNSVTVNVPITTLDTLTQTIDSNGTYHFAPSDVDAYDEVNLTVNVPGGVSSNIVRRDVNFDTTGVMVIQIPYGGNGYLKEFHIAPKNGSLNPNDFGGIKCQYAIAAIDLIKGNNVTPDFTKNTDNEDASESIQYKSSSSTAKTLAGYGGRGYQFHTGATLATGQSGFHAVADSNTEIRVRTKASSNTSTYALLTGIDYTYTAIYSE